MHQPKAPYITALIERRIRNGEYQTKIPATRDLAAEFNVARRTMSRALKSLVDIKLLRSCRRNGLMIDRQYLKQGSVLIISYNSSAPELAPLKKAITDDGLSFYVFNQLLQHEIDTMLPDDTLGVLFLNSSLTVEIAEYLTERKVPFVSCNQLPGYRKINWVDFDIYQSLKVLFQPLVAAGYRHISTIFSGRVENFNDMFRKNFLKLKRELALPHDPCDDAISYWQDSLDKTLKKALNFYRHKQSYPEVLICLAQLDAEHIQQITTLPHPPLLLLADNGNIKYNHPNIVTFSTGVKPQELFGQGYELLREAVYTPDMYPQQRLIQQKYNIPPIKSKENQ